ncbi:MAG: nuclear transport factor 2 family protein [Pseudomonadota bacterium]
MNNNPTLAVVQAYFRGWTTKDYDAAAHQLLPALVVEVPVNHYPDAAAFVQALTQFGNMVEHVDLLAELASDSQAMLLYDMEVQSMGTIRVAEHFTVQGGKITRLRQVHDTHAMRAAGLVAP